MCCSLTCAQEDQIPTLGTWQLTGNRNLIKTLFSRWSRAGPSSSQETAIYFQYKKTGGDLPIVIEDCRAFWGENRVVELFGGIDHSC